MGFLTRHAQLAWKQAVHNCKQILDGLIDLEQRKIFVSSFQNAIELCLKQYLLDINDIKILNRTKMLTNGTLAQRTIYNNCSTSTDFNSFFDGLSLTDLGSVYTSDFGFIYNYIFNNSHPLYSCVIGALNLIQSLRNKETHFYIDEESYLSIQELKDLCKLMSCLQTFFINNGILENANDKTEETNKKFLGYFKSNLSKIGSYENLVIKSPTNLRLLNQIEPFETKKEVNKWGIPRGWQFYVSDINDHYSIAHEMFEHSGIEDGDRICFDFLMNLNEYYRRFLLWIKYNLICVDKDIVDFDGKKINVVCVCQSKKITSILKK